MKLLTKDQFLNTFDRFYCQLRNFVYYKTGSMEIAEEIAQESFVILWQQQAYLKDRSIVNYLYEIASRQADIANNDTVTLRFSKKATGPYRRISEESIVNLSELDIRLQETISALTEKQRVIFLMNQVDGLKYYEIAERLDISSKIVANQISLALGKTVEVLENEYSIVSN